MSTIVPQAILQALTDEGVTTDTKDNTFRGTYKELTGETLSREELKEYRDALRRFQKNVPATKATKRKRPPKTASASKAPKPRVAPKAVQAMTEEERVANAHSLMLEFQRDKKRGWENVVRVTEVSDRGRPLRVDIACTECKAERNIAVQDLFQVHRCIEHQRAAVKEYRNALARRKRAAQQPAEAPAVKAPKAKRTAKTAKRATKTSAKRSKRSKK